MKRRIFAAVALVVFALGVAFSAGSALAASSRVVCIHQPPILPCRTIGGCPTPTTSSQRHGPASHPRCIPVWKLTR